MLPNLLPTLLLGVVLGMRHATDADHVVAVTTIVTRQRRIRDAMRIGALWGVGHTLTILLVGGAIRARTTKLQTMRIIAMANVSHCCERRVRMHCQNRAAEEEQLSSGLQGRDQCQLPHPWPIHKVRRGGNHFLLR